MSCQYGANSIGELIEKIKSLCVDMKKFSDCENNTKEITITLDENKEFIITID